MKVKNSPDMHELAVGQKDFQVFLVGNCGQGWDISSELWIKMACICRSTALAG